MLHAASKYTPVPERAQARPAGRDSMPDCGSRAKPIPMLRGKAAEQTIDALADLVALEKQKEAQRRGFNITVPAFSKVMRHRDWRWRELREGGVLFNYLLQKRAETSARWRRVARQKAGFRQNNKSELQLAASVPLYDFIRWRRQDRHFWDDEKNIKNLRRDNPNHVGSVFL